MSSWRNAKQPALKMEEAALLPAMPRHLGNGAALKSAVKSAAGMDGLRVSNQVSGPIKKEGTLQALSPSPSKPAFVSRAALRQIGWRA